jgi:integrase
VIPDNRLRSTATLIVSLNSRPRLPERTTRIAHSGSLSAKSRENQRGNISDNRNGTTEKITAMCKVGRGRPTNSAVRVREHLTPDEIEKLIAAARRTRNGGRDAALILIAYRHGLRLAEAVGLRWDQVDFKRGELYVQRLKGSRPSTHPLPAAELRALHTLQRDSASRYIFTSERGGPMARRSAQWVVEQAGRAAGFTYPVHFHMLRHGCGYALAADKQDTRAIQSYLGHANLNHTARYTALSPARFESFWAQD